MAIQLYIDVVNKCLVKNKYTNLGGLLPTFYFGSQVPLEIFALQPNPINDPLVPYVVFSLSGYVLSVELGSADADDETGPVALLEDFQTITNGVSGTLELNTQELKDLIGSEASIRTTFEIQATPSGGQPDVIFQTPINVNGVVLDPTAMPTPLPTFMSKFISNEVPTGTVDGTNVEFVLANTPISGSLSLYQNGLLMKVAEDYTITSGTITFLVAPAVGALLLANYIK